MNRLNLKIYMLNWKCREHLYAIRCMNEDKEDVRKRRKEIVMLVEEKEVWEGIRDSVRKGGERI